MKTISLIMFVVFSFLSNVFSQENGHRQLTLNHGAKERKNEIANGVNGRIDLKKIMQLGGQNLLYMCNPDKNYLAYFMVTAASEPGMDHAYNHNLGRWFDAMMQLEATIGFQIPPDREKIMVENLRIFCENPDNLPFGPRNNWLGIKPDFYLHSMREYILAVNSLVRYRNSKWAAELGHRMLETIERSTNPDGTLALEHMDTYINYYESKDIVCPDGTGDIAPHGHTDRVIEALVWFYEATGDPLSIKLADRFAKYHFNKSTYPDGSLNTTSREPHLIGHSHSYLGGLRGLFLYGQSTKQAEFIDRIRATYELTVRSFVRESGFVCHDLGTNPEEITNVPEIASAGDAAQLALWLGLQTGHMEYLDDAERWVRARIVPSQIPERYSRDSLGNLDLRMLGGWGAYNHSQGGMMSYTDVTAAVLHTLCDIYNHIAVRDKKGLTVYFHFDFEDENVRITSERSDKARLTIIPKKKDNVFVRIPTWVPANSVRITVGGKSAAVKMLGHFAFISRVNLPEDTEIILEYGLPQKTTTETVSGFFNGTFKYYWKGDEIVGACPNTDDRPFYPKGKDCE